MASKAKVLKILFMGVGYLIRPGQIDWLYPKQGIYRGHLFIPAIRTIMNKMAEHTFTPLIKAFSGNLIMRSSRRAKTISGFIRMTGGTKGGVIIGKIFSEKIKIIPPMKIRMTGNTGYLLVAVKTGSLQARSSGGFAQLCLTTHWMVLLGSITIIPKERCSSSLAHLIAGSRAMASITQSRYILITIRCIMNLFSICSIIGERIKGCHIGQGSKINRGNLLDQYSPCQFCYLLCLIKAVMRMMTFIASYGASMLNLLRSAIFTSILMALQTKKRSAI